MTALILTAYLITITAGLLSPSHKPAPRLVRNYDDAASRL